MPQDSTVVIMHVSHMFLLYRKLSRDSSFGLDVVKVRTVLTPAGLEEHVRVGLFHFFFCFSKH